MKYKTMYEQLQRGATLYLTPSEKDKVLQYAADLEDEEFPDLVRIRESQKSYLFIVQL